MGSGVGASHPQFLNFPNININPKKESAMDSFRAPMPNSYYPTAKNDLQNDPTPKDQAVYVPSISPPFAIDVYQRNWTRPHPDGITDDDLNFLDPNNRLFRISHALSSAGQALNQTSDCIIRRRDRQNTRLIGDSGGYQTATQNRLFNTDPERKQVLDWLEAQADYGMTLDAPSAPVLSKPNYAYRSTQECLDATLVHLRYFANHRSNSHLKLLNVLHGNDQVEADHWYDAVKGFRFEGIAFASAQRNNIYEIVRRVLIMHREGYLEKVQWIHALGCGDLDTAVLLTAVQRAIKTHLGIELRISFDTSSAFRSLRWGNVYTIPNLVTKHMFMPTSDVPDGYQFVGSDIPWPWPSPLGNYMRMRDFCVNTMNGSYRDRQSNQYLAHHNLSALCWGIALANRVFDAESLNRNHTIGRNVGAAVEVIDRVFAARSTVLLAGYQSVFARLRHGFTPTGELMKSVR